MLQHSPPESEHRRWLVLFGQSTDKTAKRREFSSILGPPRRCRPVAPDLPRCISPRRDQACFADETDAGLRLGGDEALHLHQALNHARPQGIDTMDGNND